ncbi:MAG: zinc ribbon domain-containing protein [Mycobacteriaceae bacterium]
MQFRVGLIIVAVAAAGFALLRWQVPVVAISVFGLPVLFAVYLREIDSRSDHRVRYFALAAVLALGLGVGWALIAGPIVADAYHAALGGQMTVAQLLLCGVAIPITFGIAMVAPAALVRAVDRSSGESLDGFTIGAVGATVVNAAATATLLAPQLAMGVTAESHSVGSLLAEAMVEGVAWPLGAVAIGGLFGIALWFIPNANAPKRFRRTIVIPAALLGAVAFSVAMGIVDVAPLPLGPYIALQLLIALSAVLAVRIVVADALLNESTDDTGEQLLCAECDHVVAHMGFCSDCGVAIRAASRTSRAVRLVRPVSPGEEPDGASAMVPQRTASSLRVLGSMVAGVGTAVAVAVAVAVFIKPAPAAYACPPDCGGPTLGKPVESNPRYSGDNGAFSVAYPGEGTAYEVTFDPPGINGVQLKYVAGDTGMLTLFGVPAGGRTPKQIAQEVLATKYPGAAVAYEIPNASVGYEPGYGIVADVYPRDSSSSYNRLRVIVMAAIRHDYALIATAAGPYHEFSPNYGTGHPSGANLEVAMDMGKYVNSFRWYGDRYARPS